ncbi:MAG: T9SS type A sorting domain-containing protein [Bacteroidetes bacterium]|nr:T9SS type A sorting domain-containing protein [Bacteroidota bacterium]
MKRIILILAFVVCALSTGYSQVNMVWNTVFDVALPGKMHDGSIDSSGNFYFVYSTNPWGQDTLKMRKYDSQGNFVWSQVVKTFDGPASIVQGMRCVIDDQQNILLAIHAYLTSANNNLYLFKYTNQGINAWSDSITNINLFYGIQTGTSGDFYVQYDSLSANYGVQTRRFSSSGSPLYVSSIDHFIGNTGANNMTLDNLGNLWFNSTVITSTADTTKWYKLDPAGNLVDSLHIPLSWPGAMVFDSQNNMTVCYNITYPPNANQYDSLIAGFSRYDSNMNLIWDTGPTELHRILKMYQNAGDVYVYGEITSFAANGEAARLSRIDTSGTILWVDKFDISLSGKSVYMFSHLLPDDNGNPVLAGGYFPPGYETTYDTDMFYVRTADSSGTITAYEEYFNPDIYARVNASRIINNQLYLMSKGTAMTLYQLCLSCTPTLTGNVYYDSDSSCTKNGLETGISSGVYIQPGSTYLHTDSSGNYKAHLTDNNYQVIFPALYNYPGSCNTDTISVTIAGGIPVTQVDHGKYLNPAINDMIMEYGHGFLRPGFNCEYALRYTNIGGSVQSGMVEFICDSSLDFLQSVPPPTAIVGDTLQWSFSNLALASYNDIHITLKVDSATAIGTYVLNNISVSGNIPDINPSDNVITDSSLVTGSFDPNDKSVLPRGVGPQGFVTASDTAFSYTIRFENTGSDTAFMVTIMDVLDADLDIATIRPGLSSHNYTWEIINGNTLRIRFINIYLPDTTHPNENKGYVCFSIRQKQGLQPGTVISNSAQIYFDFNVPVSTNTTINTIFNPLSISEISVPSFRIYPNPASDKITVNYNQRIAKLVIYNIYGQAVKIVRPGYALHEPGSQEIDISELASGIYFVSINDANSNGERFVKLQQEH